MKKAAAVLIIASIITKILGLLKQIVLSYYYGVSEISDVFILTTTIPIIIYGLLGVSLNMVYAPIYNRILIESGREAAISFTSKLRSILLIFSTIIVVLTYFFSQELISLFASGLSDTGLDLSVNFIRITILSLFLVSSIKLFTIYLQANRNFLIPALFSLPTNLLISIFIAISSFASPIYIAYGFLLGTFLEFVLYFIYFRCNKISIRYSLKISDPNMKVMLIMLVPIFIQIAASDINKIIDRNIASLMMSGGISAMSYARSLKNFIAAAVTTAIATSMYPYISKHIASNNNKKITKSITDSFNVLFVLIIPATFGVLFYSYDIIRLIYGRGAISNEDILLTSGILFAYSFGLIFNGIEQIMTRIFYAYKSVKTPVIISFIGILINIILNLLVYYYTSFGLIGIAFATSVSSIVTATTLFTIFFIKHNNLNYRRFLVLLTKILLSSLLMIYTSKYALGGIISNIFSKNVSTVIQLFIAIIIYFSVFSLLNLKKTIKFIYKHIYKRRFRNE